MWCRPSGLPRSGLPHEIGDVAADGLSESRCNGLAGDRCGDGVLKIVPRWRGPLDADRRVAIVDATTIGETSAAVVDGRFRSNRRTRSFDGIVVQIAQRGAREGKRLQMIANVVDAIRRVGVDEPEGDTIFYILVVETTDIRRVSVRNRAVRADEEQHCRLRGGRRCERI